MNLNKIFLLGRLTRDPEMRNLPSGQKVCLFGLATDRYFINKEGKKQQETEFHNIVLFGRLAEISFQYLKKGALVLIEGRIKTRTWQDNQGNKRSRTEVIAERIQLAPKSLSKETSSQKETTKEEIPIIEEEKEEEEINLEDLPF